MESNVNFEEFVVYDFYCCVDVLDASYASTGDDCYQCQSCYYSGRT
jgi:hypothetical protein